MTQGSDTSPAPLVEQSVDSRVGWGALIAVAFFGLACWLAVGLLVAAAIMLRSGWLGPLLIALALVAGAGLGLFPTLIYRREAKVAESGLRAIVAELPEQVLADARAREPRVPARAGSLAPATERHRHGRDTIGAWWAEENREQH
jgi:hypothetical protein